MAAGAWFAAGAIISAAGSLIGGSKAASAARDQAQAQNEAAYRQLDYDNQRWEMDKERIVANRDQSIKVIEARMRNEKRIATWNDASAAQRYNYDLMIRNRDQASLNEQFWRSDKIYDLQTDLNDLAYRAGVDDSLNELKEIHAEQAFDAQEQYIEHLKEEGKLRATGLNGRSVTKVGQVTLADFGRSMAVLNASLKSAGRNTRSALEELSRDKTSADLAAYAQKMLDPGILPLPIKPFKSALAEHVMPRELTESDFGPAPVLGAIASPSAAANQVWGATISSVAGSIGKGFSGYGSTL